MDGGVMYYHYKSQVRLKIDYYRDILSAASNAPLTVLDIVHASL